MGRDVFDRHRSLRVLVGLIIAVISIYLITVVWHVLATFGDIVLLFFLAWIITFVLDPVSSFLINRGFSRVLAVSLVYLALLVVISGLIVLAVPAVQAQVTHVANLLAAELSGPNLNRLSDGAVRALERVGFSPKDAQNIVSQMIAQIPQKTQDATNAAIAQASTLLSTIATILFDASLVVIISFYMMLDGGRLVESLANKLPPSWAPDLRLFQGYVNDIFGGFFRAQLIVAGIYALLTWLIMAAPPISAPGGAFLAAFLAGIFMLLPFIGAFLAIVPPALLVLVQTPPDALVFKLVLLVFLLGAAQHVVLNLIAPRVYGQHLGMDPIILFAALLLGAKEGGVWGALFAAPIVAIGYAVFETFYDRFTSTHPLFQVEERIEEKIQQERPFEDLAREIRPHVVPVRTLETHHQRGPGTRGENPPSMPTDAREPAHATDARATGTDGPGGSSTRQRSRPPIEPSRPAAPNGGPHPNGATTCASPPDALESTASANDHLGADTSPPSPLPAYGERNATSDAGAAPSTNVTDANGTAPGGNGAAGTTHNGGRAGRAGGRNHTRGGHRQAPRSTTRRRRRGV